MILALCSVLLIITVYNHIGQYPSPHPLVVIHGVYTPCHLFYKIYAFTNIKQLGIKNKFSP